MDLRARRWLTRNRYGCRSPSGFPRVLKADASEVLASQVDILPTVLGLVGEPAFEGVEGHDLSPLCWA